VIQAQALLERARNQAHMAIRVADKIYDETLHGGPETALTATIGEALRALAAAVLELADVSEQQEKE